MDTRICRRCAKEYPLTIEFFYKNGKNNFQYLCKSCQAKAKKEWAAKNKEKINAYDTKRRATRSKEEIERAKAYHQKYHAEHKEEQNKRNRDYYYANKEISRSYRRTHREEINAKKREYERAKLKTNKVYYIKHKARSAVYKSFKRKGLRKDSLSYSITGLDGDSLSKYLLSTFASNYGREWDGVEPVHIDHIIPLDTATTEEDVRRLCHYTNLQLLTAFDNMSKHNKTNFDLRR